MTHDLKTWPEYFEAIIQGRKTFEYRHNDRDFREGDTLRLSEWVPATETYTGRTVTKRVGYVLPVPVDSVGAPPGYAILSLLGEQP